MPTLTTDAFAAPPDAPADSAQKQLRAIAGPWAFAALVPLLDLMADDPSDNAMTACIYLGLLNGWLAVEICRRCARHRDITLITAIAANTGLFVVCGLAAGVETHIPFPLMAFLSVIPAIGIVPFALRLLPENPYAAILLSAMAVVICKLAGCVVARLVYGPDYLAQGYASADWRTAKLMITLMWSLTTLLSATCFVIERRRAAQR